MIQENSSGYFEQARHDVAALVPVECHRILEVGAGFGGLGRILAQRPDMEMDAVEINPDAPKYLEGLYRKYWIGDIERIQLVGALPEYDCIVFPDVLEHLVNPWGALSKLCESLRKGGYVVASLPNVRNIALLYNLVVRGRWDYTNSGLLDRTHLRFFARSNIEELLNGAGLQIERWEMNRDRYTGVRGAFASLAKVVSPEIDVCQYLVLARKI